MNKNETRQDVPSTLSPLQDSQNGSGWSLRRADNESEPPMSVTDKLVFGRADDCDVILQGGSASRKHAGLLIEKDELYVEDLNSSNGTFVNGERITKKTKLNDGDQLRMDSEVFQVIGAQMSDAVDTDAMLGMAGDDGSMGPDGTVYQMDIVRESQEGGTIFIKGITVERPCLVGVSPPFRGQVFEIGTGEVIIGRAPHSGIRLDSSAVSVEHAKIKYDNDSWQIVDLMSSNGTFVNGKKIVQMFLSPNDAVKIGPIELRFAIGGTQAQSILSGLRSDDMASSPSSLSSPLSRRKKATPVWVYMIIGFALALIISAVYLFVN